jgi:prepilin-type N-terminal cleavage/methylation domain-containing protein
MSSKGFTLLEVLMALMLLLVTVTGIGKALSAGILVSGDSADVDLALNIAQAKMEELKGTSFASLADQASTADSNFSSYMVSIDAADGDDPMQIDVTVGWDIKGGQNNVTLTTLIADI